MSSELAWADSISETYRKYKVESNYAETIKELTLAYSIYESHKDTCQMAWLLGFVCNTYDVAGKLDSALIVGQKALQLFRPSCDSLNLMSTKVFISNVYLSLEQYEETISLCEDALNNWNPKWPYTSSKDGLYTNRAIALAYLGRLEEAANGFRDVLRYAIENKDDKLTREAYMNLGGIFGMMSGGTDEELLDSAQHYIFQALELVRAIDPTGKDMMTQYSNVAALKSNRGAHREALAFTDSAYYIAERLGDLPMQISLVLKRSEEYEYMGDLEHSHEELRTYIALKDSLMNIERLKAIAEMQEKFESEKKAGEIKELKIKNLDSQLKEEKATRTRNIAITAGVGILLLSFGLWNRLLFTRRTKAIIEKEKERSEELLLNILPEEIAEELKLKGYSDAQLIEQVSVLFTDFKGFTTMSEMLTPKELVKDLHECFSAFDEICEKYGIEKIKTIGDSYMAAGGLPKPGSTRAVDVIKAAFEMRDFVETGKKKKQDAGLPYFEIRIGIHTGPVVAGIVGVKKFQYDIWGDTVNTASRMESSGEVGKINLSRNTFELVQYDPFFAFEPRGKIDAKGKGEMEMWFVREA